MASLLQANGHEVVGQAEEPASAVVEVCQRLPDVVILDLDLGMRSGFEVLAALRRRALPVRTLVTTMSGQARDVATAVRDGADGYVLKGASAAELLAAIEAVTSGRRHFQGKVAELAIEGLSAREQGDAMASLSARERQVMLMVVNGSSSAAIGAELHLSSKTVDSYRSRLMKKLHVPDVQGLVRLAVRTGMISAG